MRGDNPYHTEEEVWQDLDNAFGDADKVATAEIKLLSADFPMKTSESFDQFLTRFTSVINKIPYLTEPAKMRHLRDNVTKALQIKITGVRTDTVKALVKEIRCHDVEMRRIRERNPERSSNQDGDSRGNKRKQASGSDNAEPEKRARTSYKGRVPRSAEMKEKLTKMDACWRCGKTGHKSYEQDAPCKGKPAVSNDELKLSMAELEKQGKAPSPA